MTPAESAISERLVARARQGDHEAYRELVMTCQTAVRTTLAWRISDPGLIDEVTQDAFVAAWTQLPDYRGDGFAAWVRGIARHLLAHELRRRQREGRRQPVEDLAVFVAAETEADDAPLGRLRDCLEKLPQRARLLLERRHVAGLPLARIAQQFKQKENTIAVTLMRLRSALRDCLDGAVQA